MSKNKTPWVKSRHRIIQGFFARLLYPYVRWKYNIKITPFREKEKRPVLIIFNHQTGFDQFFVGMAFRHPVYFIATEDIFSLGRISRLISWLVAPIPIKKQTNDLRAVRTALQVSREGGTIALAPEGNRTYDGNLCYIKPSLISMIRLLKLPVVTFRIEGGYGIHPRWSDVIRRGTMKAYASSVIEPKEYDAMSDEELMLRVQNEINADESLIADEYHSPKLAEYLERAIYVCPECGLSVFESHGDTMECRRCGLKVRYLPDKTLERINAAFTASGTSEFPFRHVADWYRYQCDFVRQLNLEPYYNTPIYEDTVKLSEVILYDRKHVIAKSAHVTLYGNRLVIDTDAAVSAGNADSDIPKKAGQVDFGGEWHFDDIDTVTVLGKNKLNVYMNGKVYQFKPDKRFNALRFINIFYHYKSIVKGENNGKQFLGL